MDVCPVGAITTRDYRFKSRPWDNPEAVDTICTLCEKGCNTTAWIKAKPEWAKGAQLIRTTPRFNPEVNGYWMCDIGRFDYHWIEGDERLQRPLLRTESGALEPTDWSNALASLRNGVAAHGASELRFLVSAHASLEELFLIGRLGGTLGLPEDGVAIWWRYREKPQPPRAKFKIPPSTRRTSMVRATSVSPSGQARRGKRIFRHSERRSNKDESARCMCSIQARGVHRRCVVDHRRASGGPAPVAHRAGGAHDRTRTSGGHRSSRRVVGREGRRLRQRRGTAAGSVAGDRPSGRSAGGLADVRQRRSGAWARRSTYASSAAVRADLAGALGGNERYAALATLAFARPVAARHWLQSSNPSERWKWDFMFQDLPPVKFAGTPRSTSAQHLIPLHKVD